MFRTFRASAFLLAGAVVVGPAFAQEPSTWTTIALPVGATSFNAIGTTVTFRTATEYWLYSGITKKWVQVPAKDTATLFQANDYCIVRNGGTLHAFASHTGVVDTLEVSDTAVVVSGPASSAWVTLVADGLTIHGFGAFHGHWTSHALHAPNPTMVANRLIGLVDDGEEVLALSAHHGTFVPARSEPGVTLLVVGEAEVGTAHSPGTFRAFSAQQNRWVERAVPVGVNTLQQNEYAMAWLGNRVWAYSGLRGRFATYTATAPIVSVSGAEGVAAFVDGPFAVCYGSGRGDFVALPATSPLFVHEYHFTLVREAGQVTPFSAITGTFGPPLLGNFTATTNDAAAWLTTGTTGHAYSPFLNTWIAAPAGVAGVTATVVRDAVVLHEPNGFQALSARHGNWRPQPVVSAAFSAPVTGSTFLSIDGPTGDVLHVFDARLDRWATVAGQGPMNFKISRHTVMAHDGVFGYGFGQPSGEWWVEPLAAPPIAFDTASSIGTLRTATHYSVYSVQGSFTYTGRFPEFTQAINLGNTLRMHQSAPSGSLLIRLLGSAPAYVPLGSVGTLYVDASTMTLGAWPDVVDADGYLDLALPIPDDAALVGEQIHLQNLVLPPTGEWWLTNSVAPVLF